jgi:hypothetical protein
MSNALVVYGPKPASPLAETAPRLFRPDAIDAFRGPIAKPIAVFSIYCMDGSSLPLFWNVS